MGSTYDLNPPIVILTINGFNQHQQTTFTVRVPNSVHESTKVLARQDGISVNQFIASATAEKMASFQTLDDLRREAALGKREDFERFLQVVPDGAPVAGDEIKAN